MKEFLLEIGVEEIPSHLIPFGMKKIEGLAGAFFKENRLEYRNLKTYGTPRRLILHIPGLAEKQAESSEEVTGPPRKISFDEKGNPTQAALKFAEAQGVAVKSLQIKITPKGEYLSAVKRMPQQKTEALLKESLPQLIQSITFPKSMVWGPSKVRFVRPIRWIAALFGGKPIAFKFGEIKSGPLSYGHRFMSPRSFRMKNFSGFEKQLRKQYVLIDPEERRKIIQKEALHLGRLCRGKTEISEELLDQAVFMVEYPVVFRGIFEKSFLRLPKEVIANAMCEHQGYFPVFDQKKEQLLPYFIAVSNIKTRQMKIIQKGNERVLRSRLADARFYFDSDLEVRLVDRIEALKKVVYQESLGSQYERAERLSLLAEELALKLGGAQSVVNGARRAGMLSKADLLTGVVREFPKLQGIMGREYALLQNEPEEISLALGEQYFPRFPGDLLPRTLLGKILSIADKMDSIVGAFGIGWIPTGSEDPYGLRRQGTGLVEIALSLSPSFSIPAFIEKAISLFGKKLTYDVQKAAAEFLKQRYEFVLVTRGFRLDIIQAVVSAEFSDPVTGLKKIEALTGFIRQPVLESLQTSFKRISNIIPKNFKPGEIHQEKLKVSEIEPLLWNVLNEKSARISGLLNDRQYEGVLKELADLKEPVDRFFIEVKVMDEDEQVRQNRLLLLFKCLNLFKTFADFSRITTET